MSSLLVCAALIYITISSAGHLARVQGAGKSSTPPVRNFESSPTGPINQAGPVTQFPASLPEHRSVNAGRKYLAPFPQSSGDNSLSVNGSTAYVAVPNSASLNINGGPITVEAWVKTNLNGTFFNRVVSRYSETNGGYILDLYQNKVRFWLLQNVSSVDYIDGSTVLSPNTWYHIAGVADGTQMRVYVNGALDGSKPSAWLPYSSPEPLQIGGVVYAGVFYSYFAFNGLIDEVRISAAALYNGNFNPQAHLSTDASTKALWKFDGQTANDSSGNGNHGSLMGGAGFSTDVPAAKLIAQ